MNKQCSVILNEFNVKNFIDIEKLRAYKNKIINIDKLNIHEKNIIKSKKSYFMLSYSTVNVFDLVSYYLIEFNHKEVIDIVEIMVIADKIEYKGGYKPNGYVFYNTYTMKDSKEKNKKMKECFLTIIEEYLERYSSNDINFDSPDAIVDILNPQLNNENYIKYIGL